jgi:hypothetical protein
MLGFYSNAYQLALSRRQHSTKSTWYSRTNSPYLNGKREHEVEGQSRPQFILQTILRRTPLLQQWTRLTLLIYLNASICEFQVTSNKPIEDYFETLVHKLVREGLADGGSLETALFVTTCTESCELECPDRVWLSMRLLRTWRKLGPDLQERLEECLLNFLMVSPELSLDDYEHTFSWQPRSFVTDILGYFGYGQFAL